MDKTSWTVIDKCLYTFELMILQDHLDKDQELPTIYVDPENLPGNTGGMSIKI